MPDLTYFHMFLVLSRADRVQGSREPCPLHSQDGPGLWHSGVFGKQRHQSHGQPLRLLH